MDFKKIARDLAHCGEGIGNYTEVQAKDWFYIEEALKEAWNEAKEQDAKLIESWHIKKGGFTMLAYEIRKLKENG